MNITTREQQCKARQEKRFINKETQTSAKYLRRIEELSGAPESIEPFLETLERIYVDMQSIDIPSGQKNIGTYFSRAISVSSPTVARPIFTSISLSSGR